MPNNYNMPLCEGLLQYIQKDISPFHMPGHKMGRGIPDFLKEHFSEIDLTEIPGLDDLHHPKEIIKAAQDEAAIAFHAGYTKFLVNGSTGGIFGMILGCCPEGSEVLVARNCHRSIWNSCAMGHITPVPLWPEYLDSERMLAQITPEQVAAALDEHPNAVGAILVYPDYHGLCCDLTSIAETLHARGKLLMVDSAHGSHFPFSEELPKAPGDCGADVWVNSAHKTLPALNQAAFLHCRKDLPCRERVNEILRTLMTSSPSYPIMASMDWARYLMQTEGADRIHRLLEQLKFTRWELLDMGYGLKDGQWLRPGEAKDYTRLVVDVSKKGHTGYGAYRELMALGVQPEMADLWHLTFICTVSDRSRDIDRIAEAFRSIGEGNEAVPEISGRMPRAEAVMSMAEAWNAKKRLVRLEDAVGLVSAGLVGAYPPGIPMFAYGERFSEEGIKQLLTVRETGGRFFGVEYGMVFAVQ